MEDQKKIEERLKALESKFERLIKNLEVVIKRQNSYGVKVLELDKEIEYAMEVINEVVEGANERQKREPYLRMFG